MHIIVEERFTAFPQGKVSDIFFHQKTPLGLFLVNKNLNTKTYIGMESFS